MGRAIAERFAEEGARVAVNDINPATAAETAEAVGGFAVPFDCADRAAVERGVAEAAAALGPVELLVANHAFMTMAPFLDETTANWARMLNVNLLGTAWLIEAAAPSMVERGYGRIVAFASEWGVTGWPDATPYAASKGGIIGLVRSAARALGPQGIAVNAIAPGITDTPQLEVDAQAAGLTREEMVEQYAKDVPIGSVGEPRWVAAVAVFLCSEPAGAFVGQVVQPNGGTTT